MTLDELRSNFVYEPDTGLLRKLTGRKPYPWRRIGAGYLATTFVGKTYYLHRLVWLWHHGVIPPRLDHRDLNKQNCRIDNLRECTSAQNQYNGPRKKNNKSGAKGVVFHRACRSSPWQAKIVVAGKVVSLGYHATVEEASAAYARGAQQYAKEFARIN